MYRSFGLSRDPFGPVHDGLLFWEDGVREAARREALQALRTGNGVWVSGPEGAGRETLVSRLAGDVALEGAPVLYWEGLGPTGASDLLACLLDAAGASGQTGRDLLSLAEKLYGCLLDVFSRRGPAVVVPRASGNGALRELEILAALRVAGRPLAAPLLWGHGASPFDGLVEVRLDTPKPEELCQFLVHRASVCGRPELFDADQLRRVSGVARGFGHALALARRELARSAFGGCGEG